MSDGYHIGLLIMSALQYLAPEFIQEHRLCWLRSPLQIVTNGKKHSVSKIVVEENEFDKVIVIKELLAGLLVVQYNGMDGYLITSKK